MLLLSLKIPPSVFLSAPFPCSAWLQASEDVRRSLGCYWEPTHHNGRGVSSPALADGFGRWHLLPPPRDCRHLFGLRHPLHSPACMSTPTLEPPWSLTWKISLSQGWCKSLPEGIVGVSNSSSTSSGSISTPSALLVMPVVSPSVGSCLLW